MLLLLLGLTVALGGALLLAVGTQLQSGAVFASAGRWQRALTSPRWYAGGGLLLTAVGTNFFALALAPVSIVQSVSVIALAVSAVYGVATGQVRLGARGTAGIFLSMTGITGFIVIVANAPAGPAPTPETGLAIVTVLLGAATALATIVLLGKTAAPNRATRFLSLIAATVVFGSITTVFKALVTLVLAHGIAIIATGAVLIALGLVALGGVIAIAMLQSAHKLFPAPVVVAAITIVDPLTAALIGLNALHEADLSLPTAVAAAFVGGVAVIGVIALSTARRTTASFEVSPAHEDARTH